MTRFNEITDCHMALSTGDDAGAGSGLTAWRNADAAFIAGELIPVDQMLGWYNKPPVKLTNKAGARSTSKVAERHSMGRQIGEWRSKHKFQTCQFLWWLTQTAGTPTVENTPVGYNTHTLTVGTSNVPKWHGIHFEREGIAANELRYDLMGLLPSDLVITCGESVENYKATQEITIPYAYLNASAADIAAQTVRPTGTTGSIQKDWNHLITGNGGGRVPSGITYNANQLEVDVINAQLLFHNDVSFGPRDNTGYPVDGNVLGWDYSIVLDVVPTGNLLYALNKVDKESYAGDLDFTFSFTADATNDKTTFTYDKMYLVPFDEVNDYDKWFEGYTITLEPLDTTSSLTVVGIDNLDNTHFENP